MNGVVVVTGGGRGIGAATCRLAAQSGYRVVVNYAGDADAANGVVADVERAGGKAIAVRADVSVESDVDSLFDAATAHGPLAALVNNAGVTGNTPGRLDSYDVDVVRRVFDVNVTGTFLCARAAVRRMSTRYGGQGGVIVNLSSTAADRGSPNEWVTYAASKAAVNTMTIGLAKEVAAEGIRVNAVAAGLVATDLHASAGMPDRLDRMAPLIPLGRAGTPEEIAEGIVWLLSPAASFVTGAVLPISGGF
ncbi:NAD(P)-dependent dehydrogenase (short-subunit alcohol dehydrogenase family) [Herbihabitans rhizosphaerae]|uniref:NAD(P)-dependent dehydrogenase (Short-subunit alcohol dehydrogenase family) n=1 Tax=Herbihabitans rhizosphaerae TaxID=1872711 RepID=A0A4Q7KN35_9PSEU|nr:SDR family oxidoreductase [Herbihabitans rhizosphaerae]RZS37885.1 NAD(P)-dependent dehydrogenase (short-subunit alcohol dehydrogenase family) [Herbihabitans rhizosphaerae]